MPNEEVGDEPMINCWGDKPKRPNGTGWSKDEPVRPDTPPPSPKPEEDQKPAGDEKKAGSARASAPTNRLFLIVFSLGIC